MPLKRTTEEPLAPNLTPMIDVVFLLVIFFMTATQFAEVERAVDLELAEVGSEGTSVAAFDGPRIVAVARDGVITLDGETRTPEELQADLAAADRPKVLFHNDRRCEFQHVASAMAACQAAGVAELAFSVETTDTIRR